VCQVISQVQDKQLPATQLLPLLLQLLPDLSLVLPWLHSTNQTTIFNKKERMTDFIKGHVKKCHIHATNRISLRTVPHSLSQLCGGNTILSWRKTHCVLHVGIIFSTKSSHSPLDILFQFNRRALRGDPQ
jgi:hypothetical protein